MGYGDNKRTPKMTRRRAQAKKKARAKKLAELKKKQRKAGKK